jgi:hypothetical protein
MPARKDGTRVTENPRKKREGGPEYKFAEAFSIYCAECIEEGQKREGMRPSMTKEHAELFFLPKKRERGGAGPRGPPITLV